MSNNQNKKIKNLDVERLNIVESDRIKNILD